MNIRPPTPRRAKNLSECLQRLRKRAGLPTLEAASAVVRLAVSTLSRYENGRIPHPNHFEAILKAYKLPPDAERQAREFYAAATGESWWQPFNVDQNMDALLNFEEDAVCIRTYHPSAIPGLLQTEEYARAFISEGVLPGRDAEVELRLELRLRRQHILDKEHPPTLHVVIDEAAFHTNIGGPDVMAAQIAHLHKMNQRPDIECQILLQESGAHSGRNGGFSLFDLPSPGGGPEDAPEKAVYTQALFGAFIPESSMIIARYCDAFEQLAKLAITPVATRQMLSNMTATS